MRMVYLHNRFVPESAARVSIYDLSVMQGAAAFEMTRSFHGVHFKLREHLERLAQSCRVLGLPMPMTLETLMEKCHDVSELNEHGEGEEHRLLIVVSPGCAPIYRTLEGTIAEPWVYVADFPLRLTVAGMGVSYEEGVHGSWSHVEQVPAEAIPCTAKHRSRLHFHLAQTFAKPATWPLMVTRPFGPQRYVAEAPGANLLFVEGGTT